jgi:hypothetical protein
MEWPNTIVTIDRPDLDDQLRRGHTAFAFGPIIIYQPQVE